jgi:predicted CXXCH cytochrome family protein
MIVLRWPVLAAVLALLGSASALAQTDKPPQVARPTTAIPRGGCVTSECHPNLKTMPYTHGPVGVDACDACHKDADASRHTFELLRTGEQLCGFCHQLELTGPYVHRPVAEGKCIECHNPHGGDNRAFLRGGSGAASCAKCHPDVTGGLPVVHGPVAAGACTACHRPHSSANPKLLTATGRDLCLECHLTLKKRLDTVRSVHGPVSVDCTTCHRPHASERKMMLKGDPTQLCLGCHSQIGALIDQAKTKHDAVSSGQSCRNCHEPHGSDYPSLLLNDMVDICLSCHDRDIKLPDGTTLANMKAVMATGNSLHGPIAQRNCVACHQIHGGSNFRLLVKEYPPDFYAPFREESYALCFSCHERQILFDARTDRLTNFRNGDQNLHYLHVNKETKGRTCRACHETHASNKAKHIRDAVPFGAGGWLLPINYEKTDTGGRCSPGCHRAYAYDRMHPADNAPTTQSVGGPTTQPVRYDQGSPTKGK